MSFMSPIIHELSFQYWSTEVLSGTNLSKNVITRTAMDLMSTWFYNMSRLAATKNTVKVNTDTVTTEV